MNPERTRFRANPVTFDATKKLPGEGFKWPWPPLIKLDEAIRQKVRSLHLPH